MEFTSAEADKSLEGTAWCVGKHALCLDHLQNSNKPIKIGMSKIPQKLCIETPSETQAPRLCRIRLQCSQPCCLTAGCVLQAKDAKDERDAAENARIAAAVAAADRKAQEAAEKQASKRRAMQEDCDKVRGDATFGSLLVSVCAVTLYTRLSMVCMTSCTMSCQMVALASMDAG